MLRTLASQLALVVLGFASSLPAAAADLSGTVFRDKNANGLRDPGEEGIGGAVEVYGSRDAGGFADFTVPVEADGSFRATAPELENGCFALRVTPPVGFRLGLPRTDCPGTGLADPIGTRRYSSPRHLVDSLRANSTLHIALGDSIAEPASGCVLLPPFNQTDYVAWLGQRLQCLASGARTVNAAIGGKRSYDLLLPAGTCEPPNIPRGGPDRCDNIYDTIAQGPDLISLSIGGNDFLEIEPSSQGEPFDPAAVAASLAKLVDTRRNLQEILSAFASELPTTDVILNTVYDNRARSCASTAWHNVWIPIWDQVLRDVVWGQGERFHVAEVHPEYAHQDLNGGNCCGSTGLICGADTVIGINPPIHPDADGARKHLEKLWDAAGGLNLGPKDALGATTNFDLLFPVEERVAIRFPGVVEDRGSGSANPADALLRDDLGARVGAGDGELILSGFDAAPDGIVPTHVVAVVRYRTDSAPPAGAEADAYAFEAAIDGSFSAPAWSVTGWNTVVPIVGAGTNAPQPNAIAHVPQWREVRALLTKNLVDDGRARGSYRFPVPDWSDIATLAIRLRGETRGSGRDSFQIEWDAAWIEVYGHRAASLDVFRATSPINLVDPANLIASTTASPFDDLPPADPLLYYAIDDGAGNPARILMVKQASGARVSWP